MCAILGGEKKDDEGGDDEHEEDVKEQKHKDEEPFKTLIPGLLQTEPSQRITSTVEGVSSAAITSHPFFTSLPDFSFENLKAGTQRAPLVPKASALEELLAKAKRKKAIPPRKYKKYDIFTDDHFSKWG